MSVNSFGHLFRVTTWGESHGPALGPLLTVVRPEFQSMHPRCSIGLINANRGKTAIRPSVKRPMKLRYFPVFLRGYRLELQFN